MHYTELHDTDIYSTYNCVRRTSLLAAQVVVELITSDDVVCFKAKEVTCLHTITIC